MTGNDFLIRLVIAMTVCVLGANRSAAQLLPQAKRAGSVKISEGPEVELSKSHLTVIRWTTNNPGGSDVHYGIVRYGTDPKDLKLTAKNPIRLNHFHPETTFRVRLEGLEPRTKYYYTVTSMESNGSSDPVNSTVQEFTTP
jgi:phosphodiesterase/alkaline phosphatase D-like protein